MRRHLTPDEQSQLALIDALLADRKANAKGLAADRAALVNMAAQRGAEFSNLSLRGAYVIRSQPVHCRRRVPRHHGATRLTADA